MGILDKAFEMLENNHAPMLDMRTRLLQGALSLLADNGQTGGLQGLAERFQEAGLGHLIQSWIGNEQNLPIAEAQIHAALGEGRLQQIAEEADLTETEAADQLSKMLPDLVDRLTPDGLIPPNGVGNTDVLLDRFLGGYR
jgi:uncharacterized protein YidB (DUF937 family)